MFPAASYQYVLYGMGFQPDRRVSPRQADDTAAAENCFLESARLTRKYLAGLPSNRELINLVKSHGMQRT